MSQVMSMDLKEIISIIPHRYPFLLVDKVLECDPKSYIKAYKNVTINEPFFEGHFPDLPIMPGVLILEALAQAACIMSLLNYDKSQSKLVLFTGIDKVKFRKQVLPGDRLDLECYQLKSKLNLHKVDAKAIVDGKIAVQATLTAAVVEKNP